MDAALSFAANWFAPPKPPEKKWATPGELARDLDPTTKQTAALDVIDAALVDVAEGRCSRLMISLPPQEGKSVRISRRFPQWLLTRNPELRIAIVSYAHGVARRHGRSIRDEINVNGKKLGLALNPAMAAAHDWELNGHEGGVYSVGIKGSLTSRPVDCLRGDTRILTEYGYARIDEIHRSGPPFARVLSYNGDTGKAEWQDVLASRAVPARPIVEVHTSAGRIVRCTPDHRVYSRSRGYVAAADLQPGESLVIASECPDRVRDMQDGLYETTIKARSVPAGHSAVLLEGVPQSLNDRDSGLRRLRNGVHTPQRRRGEGSSTRDQAELLQSTVRCADKSSRGSGGTAAPANSSWPIRRRSDHRLGLAYWQRAATLLQSGNRGSVGRQAQAKGLCGVRNGQEVEKPDLQAVLPSGPRLDGIDSAVLAVRPGIPAHAGRAREQDACRAGRAAVLTAVLCEMGVGAQHHYGLPAMRRQVRLWPRSEVLHSGVPLGSTSVQEDEAVPAVRRGVRLLQRAAAVLHARLREQGSFHPHGRHGQFPLQGRHQLRRMVPAYASPDPGTGSGPVPGLQAAELPGEGLTWQVAVRAGDSSPERGPGRQPAREPDHTVQDLSHRAPQVKTDTVHLVRHLHGQRDTVYDLQVDGNSNFFADEVLVHNCLIIDDPYKDSEQADSEAWKETVRDFWTEVAVPRMGPGSFIVIVQTRWRDDDLTGWLKANDHDGLWRVINIPAQADHDPNKGEIDLLGREPGEYLTSARGRTTEDWDLKKKEVGSRSWNALYQGRPSPLSGDLFDKSWWREYDAPRWVERDDGSFWVIGADEVLMSWDMAFKDTDSSDYVCGQIWARYGLQAFLIDQVHDRLSFVETRKAVRRLAAKWPQAIVKLVEDKANGTAVINSLSSTVSGLIPVEPEGSKYARAAAVSPFAEAGQLWLPSPEVAPWVGGFIEEHASFPHGANDDRVDAMSQAINRMLLAPILDGSLVLEPSDFIDDFEEVVISQY